MKILSSFKDYYDQCWSDDVVYRRETKEIGWNSPEFPDKKEWRYLIDLNSKYLLYAGLVRSNHYYQYSPAILSFCGTTYNMYEINNTYYYYSLDSITTAHKSAFLAFANK